MEALAVFARWPEAGRVKTRLSPALPEALACDLQRAMLADTLDAARRSRAARRVLGWAEAPSTDTARVEGFEPAAQRGTDLGERLEGAFEELFRSGGRPVVIVGSDAPEITPTLIDAAFDALGEHEVALGPTSDGGFYLVGLAVPSPGLFEGVPWSSTATRQATESRAVALGHRVATLEPLADIDTPADLVALVARLMRSRSVAPATATALTAMRLLPPSR